MRNGVVLPLHRGLERLLRRASFHMMTRAGGRVTKRPTTPTVASIDNTIGVSVDGFKEMYGEVELRLSIKIVLAEGGLISISNVT